MITERVFPLNQAAQPFCAETTTVLKRIFIYRPTPLCNYAFGILALLTLLQACTYQYTDAAYTTQQLRVTSIEPDSSALALISPYKSALDAEMQAIIGEIGVDMRREKPESTLGNFICDVVVTETERITGTDIDFGVYNYGGIRQEFLNKGPVTKGKIYELLPFENFGAIVTLDGPGTLALAQKILDEGGWPVSSGIRIIARNGQVQEVYIGGQLIDTTRSYRVVMNDYMANGGDKMPFIKKEHIQVMGTTIRDMMIDHLRALQANGQAAMSAKEGRIVYVD